jgi:hypothetical protein
MKTLFIIAMMLTGNSSAHAETKNELKETIKKLREEVRHLREISVTHSPLFCKDTNGEKALKIGNLNCSTHGCSRKISLDSYTTNYNNQEVEVLELLKQKKFPLVFKVCDRAGNPSDVSQSFIFDLSDTNFSGTGIVNEFFSHMQF